MKMTKAGPVFLLLGVLVLASGCDEGGKRPQGQNSEAGDELPRIRATAWNVMHGPPLIAVEGIVANEEVVLAAPRYVSEDVLGELKIYDSINGASRASVKLDFLPEADLVYKETILFTGGGESEAPGKTCAVHLPSRKILWSNEVGAARITCIAIGPDGHLIAASGDGNVYRVNAVSGRVINRIRVYEGGGSWAGLSLQGDSVAFAGGNTVALLQLPNLSPVWVVSFPNIQKPDLIPGPQFIFRQVQFSGERVYALRSTRFGNDGKPDDDVLAFELGTGSNKVLLAENMSSFVLTDSLLIAAVTEGVVGISLKTGTTQWRTEVKGRTGNIHLWRGYLCCAISPGAIKFLDPTNGAIKEAFGTPPEPMSIISNHQCLVVLSRRGHVSGFVIK